ncbi:MAG: hypothetical protein ACRELV_04740 [Longimicrobiales bacterium]
MRFGDRKKGKGEASAPSRSRGDATPASKGVEQGADGASITPGTVDRTVFRLRFRALLKPRVRPGHTETLAGKRDPNWAASLGSFEDLEREVNRSRRFGHPFCLARVPRRRPGAEADRWHDQTLELLSSLIRAVDRVWFDGKDVYLLLPESDRAMGTAALARIREPLSQVLSEEELDGITFAVFAHGECPTSGALLSALHRRVKDAETQAPGLPEKAGMVAGP